MIARRRQSALLTLMPALAQRFGYRCATETSLARAARIDLHHLPTSFCRSVVQFRDEQGHIFPTPAGCDDAVGLGMLNLTPTP